MGISTVTCNRRFVVRGLSNCNVPYRVGSYSQLYQAIRAAKRAWRLTGNYPRIFIGGREVPFD